MARKYKGLKGHGNGYHDSAVYRPTKKGAGALSLLERAANAKELDKEKALANNMVLVVDYTIEQIAVYQMCIFCYDTEMMKIKEDHYECPKCPFVKIKEGVNIE